MMKLTLLPTNPLLKNTQKQPLITFSGEKTSQLKDIDSETLERVIQLTTHLNILNSAYRKEGLIPEQANILSSTTDSTTTDVLPITPTVLMPTSTNQLPFDYQIEEARTKFKKLLQDIPFLSKVISSPPGWPQVQAFLSHVIPIKTSELFEKTAPPFTFLQSDDTHSETLHLLPQKEEPGLFQLHKGIHVMTIDYFKELASQVNQLATTTIQFLIKHLQNPSHVLTLSNDDQGQADAPVNSASTS